MSSVQEVLYFTMMYSIATKSSKLFYSNTLLSSLLEYNIQVKYELVFHFICNETNLFINQSK